MFRSRQFAAEQACLAWICSGVSQETHWNGVCDFGTKVLTPAFSLTFMPITLRPSANDAFAQVGNGLHIFERFAGMTDHEIQLDRCPAAAINFARGVDDVFIGDEFVDDAAHPFGGGFGRERESAGAAVLEFFHQVNRNDSMRRDGNADFEMCAFKFLADFRDQFQHIGVIGGGEREQRQLFKASDS